MNLSFTIPTDIKKKKTRFVKLLTQVQKTSQPQIVVSKMELFLREVTINVAAAPAPKATT